MVARFGRRHFILDVIPSRYQLTAGCASLLPCSFSVFKGAVRFIVCWCPEAVHRCDEREEAACIAVSCLARESVLQPESCSFLLQQSVRYSRRAVQRCNQCVRQPRLVCSLRVCACHHGTSALLLALVSYRPLAPSGGSKIHPSNGSGFTFPPSSCAMARSAGAAGKNAVHAKRLPRFVHVARGVGGGQCTMLRVVVAARLRPLEAIEQAPAELCAAREADGRRRRAEPSLRLLRGDERRQRRGRGLQRGAAGAVYVLRASDGAELAKLTPKDPDAEDGFGASVAIEGSTVVVGAIRAGTSGAARLPHGRSRGQPRRSRCARIDGRGPPLRQRRGHQRRGATYCGRSRRRGRRPGAVHVYDFDLNFVKTLTAPPPRRTTSSAPLSPYSRASSSRDLHKESAYASRPRLR